MPSGAQIQNPAEAFYANGTWAFRPPFGATQNVVMLVNNTAGVLYQGDLVCIDSTGLNVELPTTATLNQVIGVVGGETNESLAGGANPLIIPNPQGTTPASVGPGWQVGAPTPIVISGFASININGQTSATAGMYAYATNASAVATTNATAPAVGLLVAVILQAYAARSTTLTTYGVTGHDWVWGLLKTS